jgi:hypothetical protein
MILVNRRIRRMGRVDLDILGLDGGEESIAEPGGRGI